MSSTYDRFIEEQIRLGAVKDFPKCMLAIKSRGFGFCTIENGFTGCMTCGWNRDVHDARLLKLRTNGPLALRRG